jgi:hypothetical protein
VFLFVFLFVFFLFFLFVFLFVYLFGYLYVFYLRREREERSKEERKIEEIIWNMEDEMGKGGRKRKGEKREGGRGSII